MKFILIVILFFISRIGYSQFDVLVWSDEFDGTGLPNSAYWNYDLGAGGWGNQEVQTYTNNTNNVRQENGKLIIDALKSGSSWTSARVKTQNKISFKYGKIVFRAKLPTGVGTWPALWMLGENITTVSWPACGEIDVMEHVGRNQNVVQSALHNPSSYGDTKNKGSVTVSTASTEFHEYAVSWNADRMIFMVDDVPFYTYNPVIKTMDNWPYDANQFLIMNIAMGGSFGGDIDPNLTAARMEIDYVRVYQDFSTVQISGNNVLQKNQSNASFSIKNIENAAYEWIVPEGVTIVDGQGTNLLVVNWGTVEGSLQLKVTVNGVVYQRSLSIIFPIKPQGSLYQLTSPEFGIEWLDRDPVNEFLISNDEGTTRIDYTVTKPAASYGVQGNFYRPLDLTDHGIVRTRIRTENLSNSLNIRINLVDENGNETNKNPVFNLFPLINDGEYYTYSFDFKNQNGWKSSTTSVDASRIVKMYIYINFGAFVSAGADSLWIEDIWVEDGTLPSPLNRPSHLQAIMSGTMATLSWNDNSTNEDGFEIYKSLLPEGLFEKIATLPANSKTTDLVLGNDLTQYYYKVKSFNSLTQSDFSNLALANIITNTDSKSEQPRLQVYPNPSNGKFKLLTNVADGFEIQIKTMAGATVIKKVYPSSEVIHDFDISNEPRGTYIIQLRSHSQIEYAKIILF